MNIKKATGNIVRTEIEITEITLLSSGDLFEDSTDVRLALRFDPKSSGLSNQDTIRFAGLDWAVLGPGLAFCDKPIRRWTLCEEPKTEDSGLRKSNAKAYIDRQFAKMKSYIDNRLAKTPADHASGKEKTETETLPASDSMITEHLRNAEARGYRSARKRFEHILDIAEKEKGQYQWGTGTGRNDWEACINRIKELDDTLDS